jgi:hypothetical protein
MNLEPVQQGDVYQDAEGNAETEADLHIENGIPQNNDAADTSTSQPPSQLSSRRSSIHVTQPVPSDVESDNDGLSESIPLLIRAQNSDEQDASSTEETSL